MEAPSAQPDLEDHQVEVLTNGEHFIAIHRDNDNTERARGYGPTPEAALADLHYNLY